jgi:tRNA dimethylallyltransferase
LFNLNKVLVICGATATGKTSLAIEAARQLNTEVISADSQLVYRGLNVGTAKPTKEEMQGIVHHMIDVVEPDKSFSVSDYEAMASPILKRLLSEGKTPIICGGTGFYIQSLLFHYSYGGSKADSEIRKKYEDFALKEGNEALYQKLKEVDEESAQKLHPNDVKRVIRALEIYQLTGKKKSDYKDEMLPSVPYVAVAINFPREELYARIEKRVDRMFEEGLVDEVQGLLKNGISPQDQCMQAIGYKEVVECLKNGQNESTMRDIICKNTRHYAKRQITFFKKLPNLIWLDYKMANIKNIYGDIK